MISRRKLLKTSVLGFGMLTPFATNSSAQSTEGKRSGIKITDVKPYVFKKATYVKIETDAGISGWGEADHDHPKLVSAVIEEICKPLVIAQDPFDSEYLWMQMFFKGEDADHTGLLPGSVAGMDKALWEMKGKKLKNKIIGTSF